MARTPLYQKAETELRRRIADGEWPVGTRLGNEFQLADEFKVSQGTMRRALISLESDGLLARKPGRGTVVSSPSPKPVAAGGAVLRGPAGVTPSFEIHRANAATRRPDAEESAIFGQENVHHLDRLLKFGGKRAALEELVVSTEATGSFDDAASSDLSEALADHGVTAVSIEDVISADITSMSESVTLSCDRNTPLLCLTRTARDRSGNVIARQVLRIAEPGFSYA